MEIHELELLVAEHGTSTPKFDKKSRQGGRLKARDLGFFAETLSGLLEGGVPLLKALEGLEKGARAIRFKSTLAAVCGSVRQGMGFSESLEKTNRIPPFFHQIVYAGEVSGSTPVVLTELARYLDREEALKRKIREALVYPGFILALGLVTFTVLVSFVLPKLQAVYDGFETDLPFLTNAILGLNRLFLPSMTVIATFTVLVVITLIRRREAFVFLLYRAPVIGGFLSGVVCVQFSRLLWLLLESGIPVLQALEIVGKTCSHAFLKNDIAFLKEELAEGRNFSRAFERVAWMDPVSQMLVASGEESGHLSRAFERIAKNTQERLESRIQLMIKLLEPGLILVIGLLVGIVVIGTVLPIFDISGLVK